MLKKIDIKHKEQILFIYIFLAAITLAVYWQVNRLDFVFDDIAYVIENGHIQSGMTMDGFTWAFGTKYFGLWNPLVWLSLMLDYQLYGMNAGAFHMTNLILHILSTLLLFWLFHRMTGALWRSAFVAAFFALHPLHVESVAWVSERKDVLSAFFWMLTLCLYVFYTEKQSIKRYLLVVFSFVLALLSKPMVVTLPVIMILLDYWPLKRFENQNRLSDTISWQLREKLPLLALSLLLVVITFYTPGSNASYDLLPLQERLANAPVAFMAYLGKTFWPHDLAVLYPFDAHIPVWQASGAVLIIAAISLVVIIAFRKLPYLCVGWGWFVITILPVIGMIQISSSTPYAMADRYHYLPSIGLSIMMAWGLPLLLPRKDIQKKILFPAGVIFLVWMSIVSWKQCGYWKNSIDLWSHTLNVTKNNYVAHNNLGLALFKAGHPDEAVYHYSKAIFIKPDYATAYNNRGNVLSQRGQYAKAIEDLNEAIRLNPELAEAYNNRGSVYYKLEDHQRAIDDFFKAIRFNPQFTFAYQNLGLSYFQKNERDLACLNLQTACSMGACQVLEWAKERNACFHSVEMILNMIANDNTRH